MRSIYIVLLAYAMLMLSCKKDPVEREPDPYPDVPRTGSRTELTLDSIFLYTYETWLWNDALPDYSTFNPRRYTASGPEPTRYRRALFDLTQYKVNPATGRPYEYPISTITPKYSYLEEDNAQTGALATIPLDDTGEDFGFDAAAISLSDIRIYYVNPGSAAGLAGLNRGDRIVQLNGTTLSAGNSTRNLELAQQQQHMELRVINTMNETRTVQLTKTAYDGNPIYKSLILDIEGRKIGYLACSRFLNQVRMQTVLDPIFAAFAQAGIRELILDLRYNVGGYVSGAQHLLNLIAPPSLNGKVMFAEHFNTKMQQGKATLLKKQPYLDINGNQVFINNRPATYFDIDYSIKANTEYFEKSGSLNNLQTVAVITTGNTASASELVINTLKPYLNVRLIGTRTYGKPVGFFGISVDKYTLYLSSFHIRNANNEADYFDGFSPDVVAGDDILHDFGNIQEESLAKALADMTGQGTAASRMQRTEAAAEANAVDVRKLPMMVEDRLAPARH